MEFIYDAEGFIQPLVFLGISVIILFIAYKKNLKLLWLAFLPILAMMFYEEHKVDVRIEREQKSYLVDTWTSIYQPQIIHTEPLEISKDTESDFDNWFLETEGGAYHIRFHEDQSNGYEMYEVVWENEPLTGRKNVLELLDYLNIDGTLSYAVDENEYDVITNDNKYTIEMNDKGRVEIILNETNEIIYQNEERGEKPEGRPLTEEEVQ